MLWPGLSSTFYDQIALWVYEENVTHLAMPGIAKAHLTWNSVKGVMFDDSFQLERLAKPPLSSVPMTTTEVEDVRRPG